MKMICLDRDGTVIAEPSDMHVNSVEKIVVLPTVIDALKLLAENDYGVILVTNQPGVGPDAISPDVFQAVHAEVLRQLAPSGVHIAQTYVAFNTSDEPAGWYKPGPGMLLAGVKEFNLETQHMYMVGDRVTDVQAGQAAGFKTVLVKSGPIPITQNTANYTADTLLEAVEYIVGESNAS